MLLDLSQNQQEYGLSNAELLHVTDQLLEFGNLRTGAQNHEIFNGRVGLNKALHTFMSDKEDALYEDILLSASDRRAGNAQVEDDPDTGYNTGGSKAEELAQQRVNAVMTELSDATGPYDRNTMTTEQLEILEEAEKTLWDKAYAGTLTEEEKNSILDRACGAFLTTKTDHSDFLEAILGTIFFATGCAPKMEAYDLKDRDVYTFNGVGEVKSKKVFLQTFKPNSDGTISISYSAKSKAENLQSSYIDLYDGKTKIKTTSTGTLADLNKTAGGYTFENLDPNKVYKIQIRVNYSDEKGPYAITNYTVEVK